MPHRIQVFTGGCSLCAQTAEIIEVGKCKDCKMETVDVNDSRSDDLVRKYSIAVVPSIVIDGKIKVVGVPNFPWFCGEEFYRKLEKEYPLNA